MSPLGAVNYKYIPPEYKRKKHFENMKKSIRSEETEMQAIESGN